MQEANLQLILQLHKDLAQSAQNARNLAIVQRDTNHREVAEAYRVVATRYEQQVGAITVLLIERDQLAARVGAFQDAARGVCEEVYGDFHDNTYIEALRALTK